MAFEIDAEHIVYTTLYGLHRSKKLDAKTLAAAREKLGIDADAPDPHSAWTPAQKAERSAQSDAQAQAASEKADRIFKQSMRK